MSITQAEAQAIRAMLPPTPPPHRTHTYRYGRAPNGRRQRQCSECLHTQERCAKKWRTTNKGEA